MRETGPIPVAELLAQTGWMRALARSLVSDEALAEDLVQESLLRAVESPPRQSGALSSWLRTVLSRLAHRARQEGRRRRHREQVAARPERSESTPAEMLERVELQAQVVDLVLALEEPFRSAIVLRYFEERSAEEIARRQGVDATTVRWRLRKAVERLRERLDRLQGSRAAWSVALAPLLWRGPVAEAAVAATAPAAGIGAAPSLLMAARWVLSGVAIMKAKTVAIAAIVSLLLLLGFLLHIARHPDQAPPAAPEASRPVARAPDRAPPSDVPPREPERSLQPEVKPAAIPAPVPDSAVIVGQVSAGDTGETLPGAVVSVRGGKTRAVAREEGVYRLEVVPPAEQYLVAVAEGYAEEHARAKIEKAGEFLQDFRLEPAVELLVTVVDAEARPLEAVEVTPAQPSGDYVHGEGYTRLTDAAGKAVLRGIGRVRKQQVNARKAGYGEVWTRAYVIDPDLDRSELTIVMEKRLEGDAVVEGRVTGPGDAPLAGITVQWIHSHGEHKGRVATETARDGTYRLVFPREQDWCAVSASGQGFAPSIREGVRPGNVLEPARVDFTLASGHSLEGEVVDEENRPVEGAQVRAMPTIYLLRNTPLHPGNVRETVTDGRGRFVLWDLSGPTTALRLKGPPGDDWGNNYHPQVEVDRRVTLRLLRFGIVRGRVLDRETGEPVPVFGIKLKKAVGYYDYPRSDPGEFFNSPQGQFILTKLDQGPLEFLVEAEGYIPKWINDLSSEPEERAPAHEVKITRGSFLLGTVVDGTSGAPLPEARIVFGAWGQGDLAWDEGSFGKMPDRQEVITGIDGAFRVREGEPGTLFVQRAGYARLALTPAEWERLLESPRKLRVALEPGTGLSGALFEDGRPSKRGFLVLYRKRPGGGAAAREWTGNLDRDAEGRFRVGDLPPGEYLLEHWRETPGQRTAGLSIQRSLRLEAGQPLVLDFGADLGPLTFQGRLLAADGKPHRRARLALRPEFQWAYTEFAATVDAEHDGRFHFLGLRPGKYLVAVTDRAGRKVELPSLEIEADLERDLMAGNGG